MVFSSFGDEPLVSVCMITYNHAAYIGQAIESILSQKVNFPVELVIGEDCSTDDTRKICLLYRQNYPDRIRLQLPEKNRGMMKNLFSCLRSCKGKYIAFCEGDDYWIDPFKLQQQVDFLESHPDYSLCAHDALITYEKKVNPPRYFSPFSGNCTFSPETLLERWAIPSASMVFRKNVVADIRPWMEEVCHGDLLLHLLCMDQGRIYYLNRLMSVYRVALEGSSMTARYREKQDFLLEKTKFLYSHFDEYTNFRHTELLRNALEKKKFLNRLGKKQKKFGKLAYLFYPAYSYQKIIGKFRK